MSLRDHPSDKPLPYGSSQEQRELVREVRAEVEAEMNAPAMTLPGIMGAGAGPRSAAWSTGPGRRVGEVCRLQGRDVDRRELTVTIRQKGNRVLVLPVTAETMAMLPEREPNEWLFPRRKRGGGVGPVRRDVVRGVIRKAIKALGIPDGERLDRIWVREVVRRAADEQAVRRVAAETARAVAIYDAERLRRAADPFARTR